MTEPVPVPETQPQPQPRRKPFNQELVEKSTSFAQFILDETPELEGIAMVFSYSIQSNDLPFAVVMGHNDALRTPPEIIHMTQQLGRTWNHVLQKGYQHVKDLDTYMGEKAKELQQLQAQITAAKQELSGLNNGAGSPVPPV